MYSGSSILDKPYIYCPYIPLQVSQVKAKTRKLKARWTLETSQELSLMFYDGLDEEIIDKVKLELYEKELKNNKFIEKKEFEV